MLELNLTGQPSNVFKHWPVSSIAMQHTPLLRANSEVLRLPCIDITTLLVGVQNLSAQTTLSNLTYVIRKVRHSDSLQRMKVRYFCIQGTDQVGSIPSSHHHNSGLLVGDSVLLADKNNRCSGSKPSERSYK